MKVRVIASLVMALCLAGSASAQSIGIFFTPEATDCDGAIPANSGFTFYIIAILGAGPTADGVTGAEYRITGNDPGWFANYTPGPGSNLALGTPIDGVGANVAWPGCQDPGNGLLLLGTISGFSPAPAVERTMRVEMRNPPTNINFMCPLVTLCDAEFTKLCVAGGEAFVNRSIPCNVGVEPATWTQVKGLYTR
jgi:hypothetical protein